MNRQNLSIHLTWTALALLSIAVWPHAEAQRLPIERLAPYSVRDLGVVSSLGPTPLGNINSGGLFYGTRRDASTNFTNRAFWKSSNATGDLYYQIGTSSYVNGCNDSYVVTGTRSGRAVVWDINWSGIQFLPDNNDSLAPFIGAPTSEALGVNASRQVVGYVATHYAERVWNKATLWLTSASPNNTTVTRVDLGDGFARSINAAGQIAGAHTDWGGGNPRAAVWANNAARTRRDLFTTTSYAFDINTAGQAVGSVLNASNQWMGFRADAATGATTILTPISSLLAPTGYTACGTTAINDSGVSVGYSWNATPGSQRAAIWFGTSARNLNAAVPSGTPTLTSAVDINNTGQILCEGWVNGARHAFLLTPTGTLWFWF